MKYYNDLEIPVRLFFKIAEKKETLQALIIEGKPSEDKLQKAWDYIYDEYVRRLKNNKMNHTMRMQSRLALLNLRITKIEDCLKVLFITALPKEAVKRICLALVKLKIFINPEEPIDEQILQKLQIDLNNLIIERDILAEKVEKATEGVGDFTFEDTIANAEQILEYSIGETMSLGMFISRVNTAKAKAKRLKQQQQSRNRKKGRK